MVEAFIEQSHLLRYQHPQDMLHFGNLARLAAESCTVDAAGSPARLADSRACGWMQYANALRVSSEFAQADEAFERAGLYRKQGTGDPLLRARLAEKLASLRTYQGRFREAVDLAVEAGEVYRELEQDHSLASTMIQQGVATLYAGDSEEAVRIFNNAIPLIDQEANPHLLLAACHNLVRGYIDLERPEQALSIYFEARDLYEEFDDTLILLRTRWQEGQLLRDLGHLRAAETALIQARKGFLERNLSHEVALVSLDLAWVYVRLRRSEELKQTVAEAVPIFRALRVGRETLAALLQLQHACGQEQQALDLISLLNRRLAPLSNRQATQK
jgi:tetratricopeptide (TPR) repeat protein